MLFALSAKCPRTHTAWAHEPIAQSCLVMACGAERLLGHFLAPWQDHLCLHPTIILCFAALMRFMGDQPKLKNQDDAQCVYEILQVCDLPLGQVLKHQGE